jgi:hypothetical protein
MPTLIKSIAGLVTNIYQKFTIVLERNVQEDQEDAYAMILLDGVLVGSYAASRLWVYST